MKTVGIIAEFNPFHNGHKYFIGEIKKRLNADCVIAVMSGNFTQRGEIASFDMYERAKVACANGVDLVLEIPPQFVLQSAQYYARHGVYLLENLGCVDILAFGSECGDLEQLQLLAEQINPDFLKDMKQGVSYGKAMGTSAFMQSPNNILGVEYLRALKVFGSAMQPFTIKRIAVSHHADAPVGEFASASWIRESLKNNRDVTNFVPALPDGNLTDEKYLFPLLRYCLIQGMQKDYSKILNISEGLEHRIFSFRNASSMSELLTKIKCKRYPLTRIRRALYSILLQLYQTEESPQYTRVLAFTQAGQSLLRCIKKESPLRVYSRITKKDRETDLQLQKELFCNEIFSMIEQLSQRGEMEWKA